MIRDQYIVLTLSIPEIAKLLIYCLIQDVTFCFCVMKTMFLVFF